MLTERQRLSTYDLTKRRIGVLPEVKCVVPPEKYNVPWIDEINEKIFLKARIFKGKNVSIIDSKELIRFIATSPYILFNFSDEAEQIKARKIENWRMQHLAGNETNWNLYCWHALRPMYPVTLSNYLDAISRHSGISPEDKTMVEFINRSGNVHEFRFSKLDRWRKLKGDDQVSEIHNLREKCAYAMCLFEK